MAGGIGPTMEFHNFFYNLFKNIINGINIITNYISIL
mgnify:CR=1 FL=1